MAVFFLIALVVALCVQHGEAALNGYACFENTTEPEDPTFISFYVRSNLVVATRSSVIGARLSFSVSENLSLQCEPTSEFVCNVTNPEFASDYRSILGVDISSTQVGFGSGNQIMWINITTQDGREFCFDSNVCNPTLARALPSTSETYLCFVDFVGNKYAIDITSEGKITLSVDESDPEEMNLTDSDYIFHSEAFAYHVISNFPVAKPVSLLRTPGGCGSFSWGPITKSLCYSSGGAFFSLVLTADASNLTVAAMDGVNHSYISHAEQIEYFDNNYPNAPSRTPLINASQFVALFQPLLPLEHVTWVWLEEGNQYFVICNDPAAANCVKFFSGKCNNCLVQSLVDGSGGCHLCVSNNNADYIDYYSWKPGSQITVTVNGIAFQLPAANAEFAILNLFALLRVLCHTLAPEQIPKFAGELVALEGCSVNTIVKSCYCTQLGLDGPYLSISFGDTDSRAVSVTSMTDGNPTAATGPKFNSFWIGDDQLIENQNLYFATFQPALDVLALNMTSDTWSVFFLSGNNLVFHEKATNRNVVATNEACDMCLGSVATQLGTSCRICFSDNKQAKVELVVFITQSQYTLVIDSSTIIDSKSFGKQDYQYFPIPFLWAILTEADNRKKIASPVASYDCSSQLTVLVGVFCGRTADYFFTFTFTSSNSKLSRTELTGGAVTEVEKEEVGYTEQGELAPFPFASLLYGTPSCTLDVVILNISAETLVVVPSPACSGTVQYFAQSNCDQCLSDAFSKGIPCQRCLQDDQLAFFSLHVANTSFLAWDVMNWPELSGTTTSVVPISDPAALFVYVVQTWASPGQQQYLANLSGIVHTLCNNTPTLLPTLSACASGKQHFYSFVKTSGFGTGVSVSTLQNNGTQLSQTRFEWQQRFSYWPQGENSGALVNQSFACDFFSAGLYQASSNRAITFNGTDFLLLDNDESVLVWENSVCDLRLVQVVTQQAQSLKLCYSSANNDFIVLTVKWASALIPTHPLEVLLSINSELFTTPASVAEIPLNEELLLKEQLVLHSKWKYAAVQSHNCSDSPISINVPLCFSDADLVWTLINPTLQVTSGLLLSVASVVSGGKSRVKVGNFTLQYFVNESGDENQLIGMGEFFAAYEELLPEISPGTHYTTAFTDDEGHRVTFMASHGDVVFTEEACGDCYTELMANSSLECETCLVSEEGDYSVLRLTVARRGEEKLLYVDLVGESWAIMNHSLSSKEIILNANVLAQQLYFDQFGLVLGSLQYLPSCDNITTVSFPVCAGTTSEFLSLYPNGSVATLTALRESQGGSFSISVASSIFPLSYVCLAHGCYISNGTAFAERFGDILQMKPGTKTIYIFPDNKTIACEGFSLSYYRCDSCVVAQEQARCNSACYSGNGSTLGDELEVFGDLHAELKTYFSEDQYNVTSFPNSSLPGTVLDTNFMIKYWSWILVKQGVMSVDSQTISCNCFSTVPLPSVTMCFSVPGQYSWTLAVNFLSPEEQSTLTRFLPSGTDVEQVVFRRVLKYQNCPDNYLLVNWQDFIAKTKSIFPKTNAYGNLQITNVTSVFYVSNPQMLEFQTDVGLISFQVSPSCEQSKTCPSEPPVKHQFSTRRVTANYWGFFFPPTDAHSVEFDGDTHAHLNAGFAPLLTPVPLRTMVGGGASSDSCGLPCIASSGGCGEVASQTLQLYLCKYFVEGEFNASLSLPGDCNRSMWGQYLNRFSVDPQVEFTCSSSANVTMSSAFFNFSLIEATEGEKLDYLGVSFRCSPCLPYIVRGNNPLPLVFVFLGALKTLFVTLGFFVLWRKCDSFVDFVTRIWAKMLASWTKPAFPQREQELVEEFYMNYRPKKMPKELLVKHLSAVLYSYPNSNGGNIVEEPYQFVCPAFAQCYEEYVSCNRYVPKVGADAEVVSALKEIDEMLRAKLGYGATSVAMSPVTTERAFELDVEERSSNNNNNDKELAEAEEEDLSARRLLHENVKLDGEFINRLREKLAAAKGLVSDHYRSFERVAFEGRLLDDSLTPVSWMLFFDLAYCVVLFLCSVIATLSSSTAMTATQMYEVIYFHLLNSTALSSYLVSAAVRCVLQDLPILTNGFVIAGIIIVLPPLVTHCFVGAVIFAPLVVPPVAFSIWFERWARNKFVPKKYGVLPSFLMRAFARVALNFAAAVCLSFSFNLALSFLYERHPYRSSMPSDASYYGAVIARDFTARSIVCTVNSFGDSVANMLQQMSAVGPSLF